ncbi:MAG: FTR1 family protein [Acetobacteraceae bacterium]
MLAIAIIVFREALEAALICGIVLAAASGVAGRFLWVGAGVAGGLAGAMLVAGFAAAIAGAFQGAGQEVLNAAILLIAVAMLGWHVLWMARHAKEQAREARALGGDVAAGRKPLLALAVVTGAAVLREGAETVLFVYGLTASSPVGGAEVAAGMLLGLAAGAATGAVVYAGLARIPIGRLFAVTGVMVLLLAAGLAAQAAGFLVQADLLPPLGDQVWNTSFLLNEDSIPGRVLHTLIGYVARPAGIQLVAWGATLALIGTPMLLMRRGRDGASMLGLAAIAAGSLCLVTPARADLQVQMPQVEFHELEFEHNGLIGFDRKGSPLDRAQNYTNGISYGVLPWWAIELEGGLVSGGGQHLKWEATTLQNTFELTEPGAFPVDLGFYAEYSHSHLRGEPDSVTLGPIVQKEFPDLLGTHSIHTLNLFLARGVGGGADHATGFQYAWQSALILSRYASPAVEFYGFVPDLAHTGRFNAQEHLAGPVMVGGVKLRPYGSLRYEVGYLFGISSAAPRGAVRWKLEYEFPF